MKQGNSQQSDHGDDTTMMHTKLRAKLWESPVYQLIHMRDIKILNFDKLLDGKELLG